jgi:hypothetical protein
MARARRQWRFIDRPLARTAARRVSELVDSALARQRVEAGDLTAYYLVNLLCRYVRPDIRAASADDEPLAIQLTRALQTGGSEQRLRLRCLGDFSLFMSGFFSDSLRRKTIDVDYYVSMGEYAYGSLSRRDEDTFAEVSASWRAICWLHGRAGGRQCAWPSRRAPISASDGSGRKLRTAKAR